GESLRVPCVVHRVSQPALDVTGAEQNEDQHHEEHAEEHRADPRHDQGGAALQLSHRAVAASKRRRRSPGRAASNAAASAPRSDDVSSVTIASATPRSSTSALVRWSCAASWGALEASRSRIAAAPSGAMTE